MQSLYADRLRPPTHPRATFVGQVNPRQRVDRGGSNSHAARPSAPFYGDRLAQNSEAARLAVQSVQTSTIDRDPIELPSSSSTRLVVANPHRLTPTVDYKVRGSLPSGELNATSAADQMKALVDDIYAMVFTRWYFVDDMRK